MRTKRIILSLLAAVFIFLPWNVHPVSAEENSSSAVTVRAGYFYNGDFMHKDEDGTIAGYDPAYYYALAGYANWKIEFVQYDSLKDAMDAMDRGVVDVVSGLSITDERKSKYLISAQKMCTSHIAVQTRADDDRYAAGDTSTMQNLTCGILKGSNVIALYQNWCKDNNLTPHVLEYDSIPDRNKAFAEGKVDAVAAGSTIEGAQKIAEFPALDLYFMFNREKTDLKAQLDRAMSILNLENPNFSTDLFKEYFPATRNTSPSFSAAEKKYMAAHPSVKVALLGDDAPFSSMGKDGKMTGILPDYFSHLSDLTGVKFDFVACASKDAACKALSDGEVSLIGKVENNIYEANRLHMILSDSYLKMNLVQITRAGTVLIKSAAVPECNSTTVSETLLKAGSKIGTTVFKNSSESFDALKNGTVDSVICTQPAATWLLSRNRASDYVISSFGSSTWDVACGFSLGDDGNRMRSILDKTITVDGGYISQLITNNTLQGSADLAGVFDRLPVSLIATFAAVVLLLLIIAAVALIVIIRRRRTERKLAEKQAELTAAVEAKKARHTFFGTVSHDMRTPLNGIIGFTNLALQSNDPAKVRDYLMKIRSSGEILTGLVNDTLVMSRIENGKYILNPAPMEYGELISGILEPVRALAAEKGIRFSENVDSTCRCTVIADRLSLQKIFLNLLSNAVKFTPRDGTVSLSCSLTPKDGDIAETVIAVSDTGIPISKEFLPHIFEPFAQENPTNADTSGSGMGLSIVKSITDAMGGTVGVTSDAQNGTVFTVILPLKKAEKAEKKTDETRPDTSVLKGKCALVCEDNGLNMEILKSILERSGMTAVGAENGKEGLEKFRAGRVGEFDIIFLDLRMPVMDGMHAAQEIRKLDRADAQTVPIFAVSADAYRENIEECIKAGMNGHIAKPVSPKELIQTAVSALTGKGNPA